MATTENKDGRKKRYEPAVASSMYAKANSGLTPVRREILNRDDLVTGAPGEAEKLFEDWWNHAEVQSLKKDFKYDDQLITEQKPQFKESFLQMYNQRLQQKQQVAAEKKKPAGGPSATGSSPSPSSPLSLPGGEAVREAGQIVGEAIGGEAPVAPQIDFAQAVVPDEIPAPPKRPLDQIAENSQQQLQQTLATTASILGDMAAAATGQAINPIAGGDPLTSVGVNRGQAPITTMPTLLAPQDGKVPNVDEASTRAFVRQQITEISKELPRDASLANPEMVREINRLQRISELPADQYLQWVQQNGGKGYMQVKKGEPLPQRLQDIAAQAQTIRTGQPVVPGSASIKPTIENVKQQQLQSLQEERSRVAAQPMGADRAMKLEAIDRDIKTIGDLDPATGEAYNILNPLAESQLKEQQAAAGANLQQTMGQMREQADMRKLERVPLVPTALMGAANAFIQGGGQFLGNTLQAGGQTLDYLDSNMQDLVGGWFGYTRNSKGILENKYGDTFTMPDLRVLQPAGEWVNDAMSKLPQYTGDNAISTALVRDIPQAVGGMAMQMLLPMAISGIGATPAQVAAVYSATGGMASAVDNYKQAVASGMTPDEAYVSVFIPTAAGNAALEGVGWNAMFGKLAPEVGSKLVARLAARGQAGFGEGATEFLQNGVTNFIANATFDETRALFDSAALKEGAIGMVIGALFGGGKVNLKNTEQAQQFAQNVRAAYEAGEQVYGPEVMQQVAALNPQMAAVVANPEAANDLVATMEKVQAPEAEIATAANNAKMEGLLNERARVETEMPEAEAPTQEQQKKLDAIDRQLMELGYDPSMEQPTQNMSDTTAANLDTAKPYATEIAQQEAIAAETANVDPAVFDPTQYVPADAIVGENTIYDVKSSTGTTEVAAKPTETTAGPGVETTIVTNDGTATTVIPNEVPKTPSQIDKQNVAQAELPAQGNVDTPIVKITTSSGIEVTGRANSVPNTQLGKEQAEALTSRPIRNVDELIEQAVPATGPALEALPPAARAAAEKARAEFQTAGGIRKLRAQAFMQDAEAMLDEIDNAADTTKQDALTDGLNQVHIEQAGMYEGLVGAKGLILKGTRAAINAFGRATRVVAKQVAWATRPIDQKELAINAAIQKNIADPIVHKNIQKTLVWGSTRENTLYRSGFRLFLSLMPKTATWSDSMGDARAIGREGKQREAVEETQKMMADFYKTMYAALHPSLTVEDLAKVSPSEIANNQLVQIALTRIHNVMSPDQGLLRPTENPAFQALPQDQKDSYYEGLADYLRYTRAELDQQTLSDIRSALDTTRNPDGTYNINEANKLLKSAEVGIEMRDGQLRLLADQVIAPYQKLVDTGAVTVFEAVDAGKLNAGDLRPEELKMLGALRMFNDHIHQRNFDLGRIDEDTYEKYKGGYLAHEYTGAAEALAGISPDDVTPQEVRDAIQESHNKYVLKHMAQAMANRPNQSLTNGIVENVYRRKHIADLALNKYVNPLYDPIQATAKRMAEMLKAEALFEYQDRLAQESQKLVAEGKTPFVSNEPIPGYIQLGAKPTTNYRPFGALTGMYVQPEIYQDFMGDISMSQVTNILKLVSDWNKRFLPSRILKKTFTVFSPAVQMGNYAGNYGFAAIMGVGIDRFHANLQKAGQEIAQDTDLYAEARALGIFGGPQEGLRFKDDKDFDTVSAERDMWKQAPDMISAVEQLIDIKWKDAPTNVKNSIREIIDEVKAARRRRRMTPEDLKNAQETLGFEVDAKYMSRYGYYAIGMKKIFEKMRQIHPGLDEAATTVEFLYRKADDQAKMAAYMSLKELGLSNEDAGRKVRQQMQRYGVLGSMYKILVNMPFVGIGFQFSGDLSRIIYNTFRTSPLTFTQWYAGLIGMYLSLSALAGEDEEERRLREAAGGFKQFPVLGKIPGIGKYIGLPLEWVIPWFGDEKKKLDVARFLSPAFAFELGTEAQTGDSWGNAASDIVSMMSPLGLNMDDGVRLSWSDPAWGPLMAWIIDKDFRGKSISDPRATAFNPKGVASDADKRMNQTIFLMRSYIPFFRDANDFYLSTTYGRDYYGRTRDWEDALMRVVGIRAGTYNEQVDLQEAVSRIARSYKGKVQAEVSRVSGIKTDLVKNLERNNAELHANKINAQQHANQQRLLLSRAYSAYGDALEDMYNIKTQMEKSLQSIERTRYNAAEVIELLNQNEKSILKAKDMRGQLEAAGVK
jgi:hypothetical protein